MGLHPVPAGQETLQREGKAGHGGDGEGHQGGVRHNPLSDWLDGREDQKEGQGNRCSTFPKYVFPNAKYLAILGIFIIYLPWVLCLSVCD